MLLFKYSFAFLCRTSRQPHFCQTNQREVNLVFFKKKKNKIMKYFYIVILLNIVFQEQRDQIRGFHLYNIHDRFASQNASTYNDGENWSQGMPSKSCSIHQSIIMFYCFCNVYYFTLIMSFGKQSGTYS